MCVCVGVCGCGVGVGVCVGEVCVCVWGGGGGFKISCYSFVKVAATREVYFGVREIKYFLVL